VNITEKQVLTLKWRLSKEGKKFYTKRETNAFYKAVERGNTDIIDITRKEKQMRIQELRKRLKTLIIISVFLFSSCTLIPVKEPLDPASLKTTEKSYVIKGNSIDLPDGTTINIDNKDKANKLNDDWFIVHKDFVKEHNENQDNLIGSLVEQIKLKKANNLLNGITAGLVVLSLTLLVLTIAVVKKK